MRRAARHPEAGGAPAYAPVFASQPAPATKPDSYRLGKRAYVSATPHLVGGGSADLQVTSYDDACTEHEIDAQPVMCRHCQQTTAEHISAGLPGIGSHASVYWPGKVSLVLPASLLVGRLPEPLHLHPLQARHKPEHRVWKPEEWAAQPIRTDSDCEGDASLPAAEVALSGQAPAAAASAACATATDRGLVEAEVEQPGAAAEMSSAVVQEASAVADRDGADAAACDQPAVAATEHAVPSTTATSVDVAIADRSTAEAMVAEATTSEAVAASEPPAAQVAKAALALKALTVKERLAACVATERHRITFGKVRACLTSHTRCYQPVLAAKPQPCQHIQCQLLIRSRHANLFNAVLLQPAASCELILVVATHWHQPPSVFLSFRSDENRC